MALSQTVMIKTNMTMNDDDDAGNVDGNDNGGDDGNDGDDDGQWHNGIQRRHQ